MSTIVKCRVCKKNEAIIGNPPKWCSKDCKSAEQNADKPSETPQVKPETLPETKIEPKPDIKPVIKQEAPKPETQIKQKPCIQCQKPAIHYLSSGNYCDNCKPTRVCSICKAESEDLYGKGENLTCQSCRNKAKEEKKEGDELKNKPLQNGALNDPASINFVHLYPIKRVLSETEDDYKTTDFFECFQFFKKVGRKKIDKSLQWRLTHFSSIPEGVLPDLYSSIARHHGGDIYLITGGFNQNNEYSNICYAVIFDRDIKEEDLEKSNVNEEKPNLNVKNFRYCTFRDENMKHERAAHSSIVVGEHLYVFGGKNKNGLVKECEVLPVNKIKPYMIRALVNPKTTVFLNEKWESIGNISEPRTNANCVEYSKRIYIFGGYVGPKKFSTKAEIYDTVEKKWAVVDLKHKFLASSLVLQDEENVYLIGGSDEKGPSETVYKWNLRTNEIKVLKDMVFPRSDAKGTIVRANDKKYLYVFGGRVNPMDYEFISLDDLENKNTRFEHVEVKSLKTEFDDDSFFDENGKLENRPINPMEPGLFEAGFIGQNVVILPDIPYTS